MSIEQRALSLYGAADELAKMEEMISELEEGVEFDEEMVKQKTIELLKYIESKVDGCYYYNAFLDDHVQLIDQKINELKVLKEKAIKRQERFSGYILNCMDRTGLVSLVGQIATIKQRKPSKVVEIWDEGKIAIDYLKIVEETKIDKKKIADDLKAGRPVEGAMLLDGKRSIIYKLGR